MKEKSKFYARISNEFYYYDGKLLKEIGGRNSFVLYCLITSRKNMANKTYISYREINNVLQLDKNITRSRKSIIEFLELQKKNKLINFHNSIKEAKQDDFICIEWLDLFENDVGWTAFYPEDFEVHSRVGNIAYNIMWVLRMFTNNKSDTSYLSIDSISKILMCDIIKVQNSIDLFDKAGLFEVKRGEYETNPVDKTIMRRNNEYKYTGNIDNLLSMSDKDVQKILNKNINMAINKSKDKI